AWRAPGGWAARPPAWGWQRPEAEATRIRPRQPSAPRPSPARPGSAAAAPDWPAAPVRWPATDPWGVEARRGLGAAFFEPATRPAPKRRANRRRGSPEPRAARPRPPAHEPHPGSDAVASLIL